MEEIIDDEREEGIELEVVSRVIALEDDGDGVGETAVSSSVEMMDVRVELVMTVDCAGGVAICSSARSSHGRSVSKLTVADSSSSPSKGPSTPEDDLCLATSPCLRRWFWW